MIAASVLAALAAVASVELAGLMSALLLVVVVIAVALAAYTLLNALIDVAIYIGAAALIVGGMFWYVDGLSLEKAIEFSADLFSYVPV